MYISVGQDRIKKFGLDSAINNLPYDRHYEELAVQRFSSLIKPSVDQFISNPITKHLPAWSRVISIEPSLQDQLSEAGTIC